MGSKSATMRFPDISHLAAAAAHSAAAIARKTDPRRKEEKSMRLQTVGARRAIDYRISVGYFGMLNSTKNLFKNTQPPPLFEGFFAGLSHNRKQQHTAPHRSWRHLPPLLEPKRSVF
jgi:hypothetical protein